MSVLAYTGKNNEQFENFENNKQSSENKNNSRKQENSIFDSIKKSLNHKYTIPFYGEDTLMRIICFFVNLLIFPAIFYQMSKTWRRQEAADFNPWFVLLQFFGGAPEGMIGAIIGYLLGNTQMFVIGLYAMFYNAYMLYFRLFGKNGLFLKKKKKNNNKKK